jgi:hypothetical protein
LPGSGRDASGIVLANWQPILNFKEKYRMSKDDIRHEIDKILDRFPQAALQELLTLLKNIEGNEPVSLLEGDHFNRVLFEDKELLQKLAQ